MSFGIGAFPFGIFATAFNINDGRPPPGIHALHTSPWSLCLLSLTYQITSVKLFPPNSGSWNTTAHGWTVFVSTLPICRSGDYVLAPDCIDAWKDISRHYGTSSQFVPTIILSPYILRSFVSHVRFGQAGFSKSKDINANLITFKVNKLWSPHVWRH